MKPNGSHAEYQAKWPGACYCGKCGNTLINAPALCAPCSSREPDPEFKEALLESYGTADALAEELAYRIGEVGELRKELEGIKDAKSHAGLTARIRELESQLAAVNARLSAAQGLKPHKTRP
jgi:hypothetical protein